MSLINNMLKDLESRRRGQAKPLEDPLGGLSASPHLNQVKDKFRGVRKSFLMVIIPGFLISLLFLHLFTSTSKKTITSMTPPVVAIPAGSHDKGSAPVQDLKLHIDTMSFAQNGDTGEAKLSFTLQNNSHRYDFSMKDKPPMALIVFYNTDISEDAATEIQSNGYFKKVRILPKGENTVVQLDLKPGIEVESLKMDEKAKPPLLILSLIKAEPQEPAATNDEVPVPPKVQAKTEDEGSMVKVPTVLTPDELAEKIRAEALDLYESGKMIDAMQKLSQGLVTYPDYKPLRETMVTLLIDDGQISAAQLLLTRGLELAPRHVPFIVLQAQILASQEQVHEAITLLNTVSPSMEHYPNYFALLAGLQQQVGNSIVSEQIYRELVTFDPDSGVWWMGYGIALEANGKRNNAMQAYRRAVNTGNLNSKLLMYTNSRVMALGG